MKNIKILKKVDLLALTKNSVKGEEYPLCFFKYAECHDKLSLFFALSFPNCSF
ncbi:hypothetical protein SAMN02745248_01687 [Hathewaya proteolytica DSM 3090]|uniref:Uncharacterized protein n=1 Tax=Hathewaya proteolytica DSM 3090 TaxID=1121331 RepID=A0A1M6PG62_9CLOT|nr:hypothetical protein SAMN02745248_01687 [Hathewaya proteolytica DSM 3090]